MPQETQAFNFRQNNTDPNLTDIEQAGEVYVLHTDTYGTTRTPNGGGGDFTFGWESGTIDGRNRSEVVDVRLRGINFSVDGTFRVDLPGAGTYSVRLAIGDATTAHTNVRVRIYDNASLLTTLGPSATTGGSFRDATYTEYTAANWPASNTLATGLVFASAIFKIRIDSSDDNGVIAHLYMTRTSSDTVSWLPVTQVATGPTSFYVAAGMTPPDKV
jgi:hypothetical protein